MEWRKNIESKWIRRRIIFGEMLTLVVYIYIYICTHIYISVYVLGHDIK